MGKRTEEKVNLKRAIFLDRDGVLTISSVQEGKGYAPRSLDEFKFYPGVINCVNRISGLGFIPVIVSNQPDVANGLLSIQVLELMNQKIRDDLGITEINNCTHNNKNQCQCRKPQPGMLLNSAIKLGISLNQSWMIGDRDSDISAGMSAGCKTIFINRNLRAESGELAHLICDSLEEAIDFIARHEG